MARMAILLPPSEGKAPGGGGPPWAPGTGVLPELDHRRSVVLAALGAGVAEAPTMRAMARYTGVLYRELDWASLPAPARRRGAATVLTVSGLWGVVAPGDPIPHYKLKMSASVAPIGKLSTWWRPALTEALATHLRGRVVWDLLPIEHAAAWVPASVPSRRRITVRFVDRHGATVSHWNKLLKGALVRRLLLEPVADPRELAEWQHPLGYQLDLAGSRLDLEPALLVFRER